MGVFEWSEVTGKLWMILLFLAIMAVMFLIVLKVTPEMGQVAEIFGGLG